MRKLLVVFGFSCLWLVVSVVRIPEPIERSSDLTIDFSWVVALPETLRQNLISGRDFHFTYGPFAQVLAFAGAWAHSPWSPVDSMPLIILAFYGLSILLFAAILLLADILDWKSCAFICVCGAALNLFSEPTGFRPLALMLSSVFAYRISLSAERNAPGTWALATGVLCMAVQLITFELGVFAVLTVVLSLGLQAAKPKTKSRSNLVASLFKVLAVFVALNVCLSLFFLLSSGSGTRLSDYQRYGLEMLKGYNLAAGLPWALDGDTTIRLAVVGTFTIAASLFAIGSHPSGRLILPLLICSLLQLKGAFIRSDVGHITQSTSPLAVVFVIIGALCFSGIRKVKLPALAWSVMFVTLCVSWPWAGLYAASDMWKAITVESPLKKLTRIQTAVADPEELLPAGIAADFSPQAPTLAFPYENYIPVKLGRQLRAPVLQAHNASTEILQRYYTEQLEKEEGLEIVYGLDYLASSPLESVQSISRMPLVFEYLYRHFRLKTDRGYGPGFYLLHRDGLEREFLTTDVATKEKPATVGGNLSVSIHGTAMCHLLKLNMEIEYPLSRYAGRPVALDLSVSDKDAVVLTTGIAPLKANSGFSTTISLIPKEKFYQVFGHISVPPIPWNTLELHPRQTDLVGVRPSGLRIDRISCLVVPPLDTRDGPE